MQSNTDNFITHLKRLFDQYNNIPLLDNGNKKPKNLKEALQSKKTFRPSDIFRARFHPEIQVVPSFKALERQAALEANATPAKMLTQVTLPVESFYGSDSKTESGSSRENALENAIQFAIKQQKLLPPLPFLYEALVKIQDVVLRHQRHLGSNAELSEYDSLSRRYADFVEYILEHGLSSLQILNQGIVAQLTGLQLENISDICFEGEEKKTLKIAIAENFSGGALLQGFNPAKNKTQFEEAPIIVTFKRDQDGHYLIDDLQCRGDPKALKSPLKEQWKTLQQEYLKQRVVDPTEFQTLKTHFDQIYNAIKKGDLAEVYKAFDKDLKYKIGRARWFQ